MRRMRFVGLAMVVISAGLVGLWGCKRGEAQENGGTADESGKMRASERSDESGGGEQPGLTGRFDAVPTSLRTQDDGIFPELDEKVRLDFPDRFASERVIGLREPDSDDVYGFLVRPDGLGRSVGLVSSDAVPVVQVDDWDESDRDGDGIPNQLDILLGAKKAALNGADYQGGYKSMDYPGGDVPRTEGVCTDVVVRTLRNAGFDLQKLLHEDIESHRKAYPMVETPDPNIDQRRVRTLLPYFRRHWDAHPTDPDKSSDRWLPGDIVFMNTMGDERPDHIGVVSDREGRSGHPLIINNWTNGYETSAMDLLESVPVTHRFRLAVGEPVVEQAQRGLHGLLDRWGFEVPDDTAQLVAVTTTGWNRSSGTLRRFERKGSSWRQVGDDVDVRLGAAGVGWGRGIDARPDGSGHSAPDKREGDRRAPAGLFELGTAFGPGTSRPEGLDWPYRATNDRDLWVDDADSPRYNEWVRLDEGESPAWNSAERLSMYRLGLVVEHNVEATEPGAGSAIFLHTDGGEEAPTLGCTSMPAGELRELLAWLHPDRRPVLLQVPGVLL